MSRGFFLLQLTSQKHIISLNKWIFSYNMAGFNLLNCLEYVEIVIAYSDKSSKFNSFASTLVVIPFHATVVWYFSSVAVLPQKNTLVQNNHLQIHTMTSKKMVRSYYCLNQIFCFYQSKSLSSSSQESVMPVDSFVSFSFWKCILTTIDFCRYSKNTIWYTASRKTNGQ